MANHLGDLGALGNDAAFALALAQFSRLREDWLRNAKAAFGHRLMMDCITPGGVDVDLEPAQIAPMLRLCDTVEAEVRRLADIFEDHAGLQDRFLTTGRVTPALAAQLGLTGLAGRASSQAWDLRCDHPFVPYTDLRVAMAVQKNGDVAARVAVRFEEVFESLRMIRHMVTHLPVGAAAVRRGVGRSGRAGCRLGRGLARRAVRGAGALRRRPGPPHPALPLA